MQFFVIIPMWLLLVFAIAALAGVYALMQAIPYLIILLIIFIVVGLLWVKFPIATTIVYFILLILSIAMVILYGNNGLISTNVEIYRATDKCVFYDEQYEEHVIDEGTVFALYDDDKKRSEEKFPKATTALLAYRTYCIVHSPSGQNITYYVASAPESSDAENLFGITIQTVWHREKISDMSKIEFENTKWWETSE